MSLGVQFYTVYTKCTRNYQGYPQADKKYINTSCEFNTRYLYDDKRVIIM